MKIHTLNRETEVIANIEDVFQFFRDPQNLLKITPDTFPTKIINDDPILIKQGTVIKLKMKLFKIFPIIWHTKIDIWDPPRLFVDTQPKGPYRYWRHEHIFEELSNRRTKIIDRLEYAVPGFFLEPIINWLIVRRGLEKLFDYRQKKYREYLHQLD